MQASLTRMLQSGKDYHYLFPVSTGKDMVIVEPGKAQLHHTINLIRALVHETKNDTKKLAHVLKGNSLKETCRNIWHFVYDHIQYRKDKPGIEQVRRPARTWADRVQGVDCDCYTVFISSVLLNLSIPHQIRITKYGGKRHFQHIYPIVPAGKSYFTLDCVTDAFNYEVPYSEKRDFTMQNRAPVGEIMDFPASQVSGVDSLDLSGHALGLTLLKQPVLSLRTIQTVKAEPNPTAHRLTIWPVSAAPARLTVKRLADVAKATEDQIPKQTLTQEKPSARSRQSRPGLWWKLLIAAGTGYGAYKLLGNS